MQSLTSIDKLAIEGGTPIRHAPLSPWPSYSEEEIAFAGEVLRSGKVNYWTGNECREFEAEYAQYMGTRHAVSLANGTLALELALRVLDIGLGDEVIVTPRSYFASASCVAILGAMPVFADVDPDSQNLTAASIAPHITPRTKAIIAVHLAGWPCDMREIMQLAEVHGLAVVEDCAQAHGSRIDETRVGSFGQVGCFSFCQDKIMSTAGEGGMLITNDESLWSRAWSFKDHGKSWNRVNADDHPPGFRWLHETVGSNYRMTEIQGGIGRLQLRRLDEWVKHRRENALRYIDGLSGVSALRIPIPADDEYHAYYKFYMFVRPDSLKAAWSRDRILRSLQAEGVPGWSGSCPEIYREKAFASSDNRRLSVAKELGDTSIMLPTHPTLQQDEIDDIVSAVTKVMHSACR